MAKFRLYLLTGRREDGTQKSVTIEGNTIEQACALRGIGRGTMQVLDFYREIPKKASVTVYVAEKVDPKTGRKVNVCRSNDEHLKPFNGVGQFMFEAVRDFLAKANAKGFNITEKNLDII